VSDASGPAPEPRQRWRLVVARDASAPPQNQRELTESWEAAILAAGLPVAWTEAATPRPRISFGAPLPVGMVAHGELIDVVLVERWPTWRVRAALGGVLPTGWRLVDLGDVWLAGPPLAGRVAAADYRISLGADAPDAPVLASACELLLAASALPRDRQKGDGMVRYDLRPLLVDVGVAAAGPPVVLRARTRFHPELGSGRPEEVVAALADAAGVALEIAFIERERLILADDLE
jgi:radical SAM-linked protein